ncbi:hypothetical protein BJX64DRAFT_291431 [Aspergillus heterothallicus]
MNITLTVPDGSTTHGSPELLCKPPEWYEFIIFFFANYVAHVATLVSVPGQGTRETINVAINALLIPSSGIGRAVDIFFRHPIFRRGDQLKKAAAAGALCMVVRVRPESGDTERFPIILEKNYPWMTSVDPIRSNVKVHGHSCLPAGYAFAYVPTDAPLSFRKPQRTRLQEQHEIASAYNFPKAIISLVQAVWAIVTLYQSRGDQIERYGYAAFGLTVAPYAWMSMINLIATCLAPEYPTLYMVRTAIMNEAEEAGGIFQGEIGDLDLEEITTTKDNQGQRQKRIAWLTFLIAIVPLIVVGSLTHFKAGGSSSLQRGFMMAWLIVGIAGSMLGYTLARTARDNLYVMLVYMLVFLPIAVPAIGGFVLVGKMIEEYGTCIYLR